MVPRQRTAAARLSAEQLDSFFVEERRERSHRVAPTADAGDEQVRQSAVAFEALLANLTADDALKVSHNRRIRMRTHDASEKIVGVLDVRHPVPQGFVNGVLQRLGPLFDPVHRRAEESHPEYIQG